MLTVYQPQNYSFVGQEFERFWNYHEKKGTLDSLIEDTVLEMNRVRRKKSYVNREYKCNFVCLECRKMVCFEDPGRDYPVTSRFEGGSRPIRCVDCVLSQKRSELEDLKATIQGVEEKLKEWKKKRQEN